MAHKAYGLRSRPDQIGEASRPIKECRSAPTRLGALVCGRERFDEHWTVRLGGSGEDLGRTPLRSGNHFYFPLHGRDPSRRTL